MSTERQRWQALEIKHNVIALGPVELLIFANNSAVPREKLRAHLIESAILAQWAREATDATPDPVFKIIEMEFLGRVEREFNSPKLARY